MTPRRTFLAACTGLPAVALPLGVNHETIAAPASEGYSPFVTYTDTGGAEWTIPPWHIFETRDNPAPEGGTIILTTITNEKSPYLHAVRYATEDRDTINARWWQAVRAAQGDDTEETA